MNTQVFNTSKTNSHNDNNDDNDDDDYVFIFLCITQTLTTEDSKYPYSALFARQETSWKPTGLESIEDQ